MSPLPLLACFILLGGLILALLYAIRRGIQEQEERDAIERELEELEGLIEYEDIIEESQALEAQVDKGIAATRALLSAPHFSGSSVTHAQVEAPTPTKGSAS